jgi:hypothetical protein
MRASPDGRRSTWVLVSTATLVASGCLGGDSREVAEPPSSTVPSAAVAPAPAQRIAAPEDFEARASAFRVVLGWTAPERAEGYRIFRDGVALTQGVLASDSTYADDTVVPGKRYVYEIEALGANDALSVRSSVSTTTPVPPLRAARLEGVFAVKARFVSKTGYGDYTVSTYGWRLRPACRQGACDVTWRDLHQPGNRAKLVRRGSRYRGSFSGGFGLECAGARVSSSVTLDLEVTKARAHEGEWRATAVEGSIEHSEAAQLGCRASRAEVAVRGRLVR